jgi:hypothetical protein
LFFGVGEVGAALQLENLAMWLPLRFSTL